jgi:hypothetical protein
MLLSIGDQVRPGTYRLHSRFSRAVNFERAGRLVSVVDETIGPGPLNIVLSVLKGLQHSAQRWNPQGQRSGPTFGKNPDRGLDSGRVTVHGTFAPPATLRVTRNSVLLVGRRYPYTSRHRYSSLLTLRSVAPRRLQRNLSVLGDALIEDAPLNSLAFLLDNKRRRNFRSGFERAYAEQIKRGARQVLRGNFLEGIPYLKGCGPGLTPGGDDFIAGVLIGLHVLQKLRRRDLRSTMNAIFRAARGDNLFSNTFLDLARQGWLLGRIKDLVLALGSIRQESVRKAASALFSLGETSGADLATGIFLTLHDFADSRSCLGICAREGSGPQILNTRCRTPNPSFP